MPGHVFTELDFAVDWWRSHPRVSAYFLTHAHADHTAGLSSSWGPGPVYTSTLTKAILRQRFPGLSAQIITIDAGDTKVIRILQRAGQRYMQVKAIDATHCPGALMFEFRGEFGRMLYTGDFRFSGEKEEEYRSLSGPDVLYIDNTFCHPRFVFPTRAEAAGAAVELCRSSPGHRVVVGVDSLGKEELLAALAQALDTQVLLSEERFATVALLDGVPPQAFTDADEEGLCRVRAVPKRALSCKNVRDWSAREPTLALLPTGWALNLSGGGIHYIPYSLHSSYPELCRFVSVVRPRAVRPVVERGPCRDISSLRALLAPASPPRPLRMPPPGAPGPPPASVLAALRALSEQEALKAARKRARAAAARPRAAGKRRATVPSTRSYPGGARLADSSGGGSSGSEGEGGAPGEGDDAELAEALAGLAEAGGVAADEGDGAEGGLVLEDDGCTPALLELLRLVELEGDGEPSGGVPSAPGGGTSAAALGRGGTAPAGGGDPDPGEAEYLTQEF
eukprot:tig00020830_g14459.t1